MNLPGQQAPHPKERESNLGSTNKSRLRRTLIDIFRRAAPGTFRALQLRRFQEQSRFLDNLTRLTTEDIVMQVEEYHGRFALNPRSDLFRRLVLYGHYEPDIAQVLEEVLMTLVEHHPQGFDAIDVGANIGFHSVLFLTRGARRCLALEPIPSAAARLRSNLDRNGLHEAGVVEPFAAAATDGNSVMEVIDGMEEYSAIGCINHAAVTGRPRRRIEISTRRLDRLIEEHGLEPRLLKIDTEGSEWSVLQGAEAAITTFQPVILVECSGGDGSHPVLPWLVERGYVLVDPLERRRIDQDTRRDDVLAIPTSLAHLPRLTALLGIP